MSNRRGGLFFGVIVGTLLGILFAPRKGKELRKQLKDEVKKGGVGTETLKKNFVEMGHDIADTAEEVYSMPEVQDQVNKGKKHVDKFVQQAEGKIGEAERQIKNLGEKYLDLDDEKMHRVSEKIHQASKKVQGKIQTLRQKLMGEMGFSKKPISKDRPAKRAPSSRSKKSSKKAVAKPRTKTVKIKKGRS